MPRSKVSKRAAVVWDRVALALLMATLVVGVGLGGTGSLAVRTTVTALALVAAAAIGLSCLCEGRWRFVGGPLWILPIAVAGWAFVQFFAPASLAQLTLPNGTASSANSASWNSFATLQFALWGCGLFVVMFVAAHAVRSASRMRVLAGLLGGVVLLVGAVGVLQSAAGNQSFLGMYSVENRRLSAWGRDWISNETSFGVRASMPWRRWEVAPQSSNDPTHRKREAWLEPMPRTARFGSYLNASDWSAVAALIAPFLLAVGACYLRRVTALHQLSWDVDAPRGFAFAGAAALLVAASAGLGDPVVGLAGYLASLIVLVTMAPKADRAAVRRYGIAALLFAAGASVAAVMLKGGPRALADSWNRWFADTSALAQIFIHNWRLGAGFGSIADLWPMARQESLETASRGSALMSLAADAGAPLIGLAVVLLFLGYRRWRKIAPVLSADARLLSAGVGGALTAWFAHAALGPGGDAPSVLLLATVFLGLAARGLVGAIRIPEGAWSK